MKLSITAAKTYLRIALLIAVLPIISIIVGAVATKTGLLDWKLGFGLLTFRGPPMIAMLSVATGVIGLVVALLAGIKELWLRAAAPLVVTLAVMGGFMGLKSAVTSVPPIHDVATDWSEPLTFSEAVMASRGAGTNAVLPDPLAPDRKSRVADLNAKACPEAKPAVLAEAPAAAHDKVKAALVAVGLTIVTDDASTGRIEAVATSRLYGFKDDVVARIRAKDAGTQVDFRSVSRVGMSDLGANCKRITAIRAALLK
jgi:fatty-acyl-CoA synthase